MRRSLHLVNLQWPLWLSLLGCTNYEKYAPADQIAPNDIQCLEIETCRETPDNTTQMPLPTTISFYTAKPLWLTP